MKQHITLLIAMFLITTKMENIKIENGVNFLNEKNFANFIS